MDIMDPEDKDIFDKDIFFNTFSKNGATTGWCGG